MESIEVLSISKPFKGAGSADYYINLAKEDYYMGGLEPPGFWLGEGARALGLLGTLEKDAFRNLLAGFTPDGNRRLVHNAGSKNRRSGWDLTWSVPKSVSVLWSQADDELRAAIEREVCSAVRRSIQFLATVGIVSRRGKDGHVHETAQLILGAFEHSTSRAMDPQLHVHTILINIGIRPDGTTGALEPRELYRHQLAAGALFRAELGVRLERELGLRVRRSEKCFELVGVPVALMEEFSKRRMEIEKRIRELGVSSAAGIERVVLDTRGRKEMLSREELFPIWQAVGQKHYWGQAQIEFLRQFPYSARDPLIETKATSRFALEALTDKDSHFAKRHLIAALAVEAQGRGLDAAQVLSIGAELLQSQNVVPLLAVNGEPQWTTLEMLLVEEAALRAAELLFSRDIPTPNALPYAFPTLSEEQLRALSHVCSGVGGLKIVTGVAGTGKSTLFSAAHQVWKERGLEVIGACLAGKAAMELSQTTGIASQTLHRTLMDLEQGTLVFTATTVVLLDEASMVGTRGLKRLCEYCVQAGATLVMTGDPRQLQSVEAGGIFAELIERYGAVSLSQIRRQDQQWARDAVEAMAVGEPWKALAGFEEHGLLQLHNEGQGAMERVVEQASDQSLILTSTGADALAINLLRQEARVRHGEVAKEGVVVGAITVRVGDRILFGRNSISLGVWNGQLAEVVGVHKEQIVAKGGRPEFS